MKAVCWHGIKDVRITDVEPPALLEPDDAILRVTTAAICGSDLHLYHGKIPKLTAGTIIGHEFAGVVEQVGAGVRLIEQGRRYVASMYTACGRCPACLAGRYLHCPSYAMFGCGPFMGNLPGGQAEYVCVPLADMTLCPVPADLDDEEALFVGDILATAYTGCVEAGIQPGEIVAVVGAGPVGQLAVACAQLFSPAAVYVVDLVADRLEGARRFGGIPIDGSAGDPMKALREQTGGRRADVVLEAVGNAKTLETAWRMVDTGGRLILIGMLVDEPFPQTAGQTWLRNLSITTIAGQPYAHRETLLRLIQARKLHPARIVSERVPLAEVPDAYARLDRRETTKVIVKP